MAYANNSPARTGRIRVKDARERGREAFAQAKERTAEASNVGAPEIDARELPNWFHVPQNAACTSLATDIVVCAGHQSGKTEGENHWLLRELQRCAPFIAMLGFGRAIFAGPTLSLLDEQAIPNFERVFVSMHGLGRLTRGNKPSFRFSKQGLRKLFGWLDVPVGVRFAYTSDSSNLESVTACCGTWDESGQKENRADSLDAYDRRLTIARGTTFEKAKAWIDENPKRKAQFAWWIEWFYDVEGPSAIFGRRMFGTTPYQWNFFKTEIYDRALKKEPGYELFNFPTWANPLNDLESLLTKKAKMPDWKWTMMYEGFYTKPAGVIYDAYSTVPRVPRFPNWQIAAGHDFGKLNNAGIWAYRHPTNLSKIGTPQWVVYSTYLRGNRTAKEHIAAYLYGQAPASEEDPKLRAPDTWRCGRKQNEEGQWSVIAPWAWGGNRTNETDSRELYSVEGYPIIEPPISGVNEGIDFVYAALKTEEIVICADLVQLITDLNTYSNELDDGGEPNQDKIDQKSKWHRMDCLRYLCVGLFAGAEIVKHNKGHEQSGPEDQSNLSPAEATRRGIDPEEDEQSRGDDNRPAGNRIQRLRDERGEGSSRMEHGSSKGGRVHLASKKRVTTR